MKRNRGIGTLLFYIVILVGAYVFMMSASGGGLFSSSPAKQEITFNEFSDYVENGMIDTVEIAMGKNNVAYVKARLKNTTAEGVGIVLLYAPADKVNDLLITYDTQNPGKMDIVYDTLSEESWSSILMTVMTFVVIGFVAFFFISQQSGGNGKVMNFGKSKARMFTTSDKTVTFEDVAGADEEKDELAEIVDFLKHPERYEKLGARIPKGVLLVGSPGTGKTLLARATAGEAGVPFFTISGSDFVEMFVGVGASRVRDLFDTAKKNSPCIIFIDEIDAVGRQRGTGLGGGNDEREQTLNQLLVEMDGFNDHQGIIILAATNRVDILDPALLRPGRFDRQIVVHVPDVKGREEILKVHSRNKPLADDVDLNVIAKSTAGMTGADLENVMNEASLLAARQRRKTIRMHDIEESIMRVLAGPEKKSMLVTDDDKRITAYHEVGHAIVGTNLEHCDPVHEISIIPRGTAAGVTISIPDNDNSHISRRKVLDEITMSLGGRASEEIMLDDICAGAVSDIDRATKLARKMITEWGMSEKLGPINYGADSEDVFIGKDLMKSKGVSETTATEIDRETRAIIDSCYQKAKKIVSENRERIEIIVKELYKREVLSGDEFRILAAGGTLPEPEVKKPGKETSGSHPKDEQEKTPAGEAKEETGEVTQEVSEEVTAEVTQEVSCEAAEDPPAEEPGEPKEE